MQSIRDTFEPDRSTLTPNPSPPSPAYLIDRLLLRVARGDEIAFRELYRQTSGRVFGIVTKVVRDPRLSEDVTQEVFLEIWNKARSYDPVRGSGLGWMLMLGHRRAVDRVRCEQRQSRFRGLEAAPFDVVSETVEQHLDSGNVQHALNHLTPDQRNVVDLAFYRGLTHRQVADHLDIPLGTMKTRLRRALISLRSLLE